MQADKTDAKIIDGIKKGIEDAYKYLYQEFYALLCVYARDYVQDRVIAEAIVSDVIFEIWKNRETLEINYSLRNYLFISVRNRCINWLNQYQKEIEMRSHFGELIDKNDSTVESHPLANLLAKELDIRIKESINNLPEQTKEIFNLSRFQGMKYEEIATSLGISTDVVKYHIKSALSKLRDNLKDYL